MGQPTAGICVAIYRSWDIVFCDIDYELKDYNLVIFPNPADFHIIYQVAPDRLPLGLGLGWMQVIAWFYENRGDTTGYASIIAQNKNLQPFRKTPWI